MTRPNQSSLNRFISVSCDHPEASECLERSGSHTNSDPDNLLTIDAMKKDDLDPFPMPNSSNPYLPDEKQDLDVSFSTDSPLNNGHGPLFSPNIWYMRARELMPIALPIMSIYMSRVMITMVLYSFMRNDKIHVAAAGFGEMVLNFTAYPILTGMLGALDTLASQSLGSGNYPRVTLVLHRSIIICFMASIPIMICWIFTEDILLLLSQDPAVSKLAAKFIHWQIPGIPFFIGFEALRKYLQAQGIVWPSMITIFSMNSLSIGIGYILIFYTNLGFFGFPIALLLANILDFVAILTCIIVFRYYVKTYARFNLRKTLEWAGVVEFIKLGFPGAVMVCAEWIGFEIHTLVLGLISIPVLNAQIILLKTNYMVYLISFGMGSATSTLVGRYLGSNQPRLAIQSALTALINTQCCVVIIAIILLLIRQQWARLFAEDELVVSIFSKTLPIMTLFLCSDAALGVFSGIIYGAGRQKMGAILNLISHYLIGLPLGISLALKWGANLGTQGVWTGLAVASWSSTTAFIVILTRGNWKQWSLNAQRRSLSDTHTSFLPIKVNDIIGESEEIGEGIKVKE